MSERRHSGLAPDEEERLAILVEECGEAVQAVCKVLRHGPTGRRRSFATIDNRGDLERECGGLLAAVDLLCTAGDVDRAEVGRHRHEKVRAVAEGGQTHHQTRHLLDLFSA